MTCYVSRIISACPGLLCTIKMVIAWMKCYRLLPFLVLGDTDVYDCVGRRPKMPIEGRLREATATTE